MRSGASPRAAQRARRPGADCVAAGTPGRCSGMSGGTLDGALGRVVAWSSMVTSAGHSGAAVRCIREGARECVPGGRGGRADVHSGSRPARPGRPGRVGDRLRHSAPVQGAVSCTSSRRSSCASASSPRPVAASTSPRFTCGASSSGRNASPWRYVAMPTRRLSTRAPSPCSLTRPAMAVACTTRVAGRLASCGTGNRGTWLQSTPPARGRHPRTALDRRRASNHAPARGDGLRS